MRILVDTNILVRSVQKSHPAFFLSTQNIAEFWNVCTRPTNVNGLGLSIAATDRYTAQLEKFFAIVPESTQAFDLWRRLVVDHAIMGVKVHDARLVAIMGAYSIPRIITFNTGDFARFPGIVAVHPASVQPDEGKARDEGQSAEASGETKAEES